MSKKPRVLRNSLLAIISLLILIVLFYHYWDIPVAHWFQQQPHGFLYKASSVIARIFTTSNWLFVAVICLAIGGLLLFVNKKQTARPWLFFAGSFILVVILQTVLKVILGRYRPVIYFSQGLYGFHFFTHERVYNSMPSGHAASAFAGFFAIAKIINKKIITLILLLCALLVALSRLVVVAHYPSDVICGAYVGILSVYWVNYFYPLRKKIV